MRIYSTIVFITTVLLSAIAGETSAQHVTLHAKDTPLSEVLATISKQTGYNFVMKNNLLDAQQRVSLSVKEAPLKEVVAAILADKPLGYEIQDDIKVVVIKEKGRKDPKDGISEAESNRIQTPITGRVLTSDGRPLEGATIRVVGENRAVTSDAKGEFTLRNVPADASIAISYLGYAPLVINLKDATVPLEIKLNTQTGELEEVAVNFFTGYQNIPKERATGSFVQIDNELFNRSVSTNVMDRILNVTSGLVVNKNVGIDGVNSSPQGLTIRGISTINSSKVPLVVVDNFPYEGDLNALNPNNIESVTVLKDAAAASIWGTRAGNGVIVITTKTGKFNQKPTVNFNSNVTVGEKPDVFYIKTMSSADEIAFERQQFEAGVYNDYDDAYPGFNYFPVLPPVAEILLAARRGEIDHAEAERQIAVLAQHDVRNDITKYLLQESVNQQYALDVRGGSDNYSYFASVGLDRNRPNSVGTDYSRYTLNFNNTFRPVKNLEISGFITYMQSKSFSANNIGLGYANLIPIGNQVAPYTMLADENGRALATPKPNDGLRQPYIDSISFPGLLDWNYRPLDEARNGNNTDNQFDVRMGGGINYQITSDFSASVKYQYQRVLGNTQIINSMETYYTRDLINQFATTDPSGNTIYPVPLGGIIDNSHSDLTAWNGRFQLNYRRSMGVHEVNGLAGYEIRETSVESASNRAFGYNSNTFTLGTVNPTTLYTIRPGGYDSAIGSSPGINGRLNRFASMFANGSYTYGTRYTLTLSGRSDQSNFFGVKANDRKVPLWSAGVLWTVSNESFYKVDWLPELRLRATYGFNGNTNNSATAFTIAQYQPAIFSPIRAPYATISSPPNPTLRWEKVRIVNVGVDFRSNNDRISGTIEYYKKEGLDLISPINIDPTSGVSTYTGNNATIKGSGLDITLNSRNINAHDFGWQSALLVSYNTDKVTSYEVEPPTQGFAFVGAGSIPIIGQPLFGLYSYRWAGLDPTNGNARFYLADTVANAALYTRSTFSDLVYNGRAMPAIFGSFLNTLHYKRTSLSFNMVYKLGYHFRRSSVNYASVFNSWGGHADYALRWQKPGDELITDVPRLAQENALDVVYQGANILVENGGHIRLQDIRVSYELEKANINRLPFNNIQFYVYASNLGILWNANDHKLDPDFGSLSIPNPRSFAIGMNVTF